MEHKLVSRIWGIAKGVRSTKGAAAGAFCSREYEPDKIEAGKNDFSLIIAIERDQIPKGE